MKFFEILSSEILTESLFFLTTEFEKNMENEGTDGASFSIFLQEQVEKKKEKISVYPFIILGKSKERYILKWMNG